MEKKNFLQMALEEMEIYSYDDYRSKIEIWEDFNNRVFQGGQEKIDNLRDLVVNYYDSYQYSQLSGQYISVNPMSCHNDLIDNYMCLFPKRALIETSALLSYIDMTPHNGESYDLPPNDFMKQYFRFKNLIQHNIAFLYPINTHEETNKLDGTIFDSTSIIPLKNVADVSQNGNLNRILQNPEMFYIAFPWLYNARTDDFIEICDKYPSEFDCLANAIEKIAQASNGQSDLQTDVLRELKDALTNIQISFEKKKAVLKSKGVTTIDGIALTCVPFAVSNYFDNFDPLLLQTILGSASLLGSKDLLNDFFSLKKEGNLNPYWVIWKWKQTTSKLYFT